MQISTIRTQRGINQYPLSQNVGLTQQPNCSKLQLSSIHASAFIIPGRGISRQGKLFLIERQLAWLPSSKVLAFPSTPPFHNIMRFKCISTGLKDVQVGSPVKLFNLRLSEGCYQFLTEVDAHSDILQSSRRTNGPKLELCVTLVSSSSS